jgi:hypothetical protein
MSMPVTDRLAFFSFAMVAAGALTRLGVGRRYFSPRGYL